MKIKQAIKKAVENGYEWNEDNKEQKWLTEKYNSKIPYRAILLDPEFWKALGKALDEERTDGMIPNQANWKEKWHKLIDHLAENKSIEDYFKQLK